MTTTRENLFLVRDWHDEQITFFMRGTFRLNSVRTINDPYDALHSVALVQHDAEQYYWPDRLI